MSLSKVAVGVTLTTRSAPNKVAGVDSIGTRSHYYRKDFQRNYSTDAPGFCLSGRGGSIIDVKNTNRMVTPDRSQYRIAHTPDKAADMKMSYPHHSQARSELHWYDTINSAHNGE